MKDDLVNKIEDKKREPGAYHVCRKGRWQIAEFHIGTELEWWHFGSRIVHFGDEYWDEIDERRIDRDQLSSRDSEIEKYRIAQEGNLRRLDELNNKIVPRLTSERDEAVKLLREYRHLLNSVCQIYPEWEISKQIKAFLSKTANP